MAELNETEARLGEEGEENARLSSMIARLGGRIRTLDGLIEAKAEELARMEGSRREADERNGTLGGQISELRDGIARAGGEVGEGALGRIQALTSELREAELRLGEEGEESVRLSLWVGELGERERCVDLAARARTEDLARAEAGLREDDERNRALAGQISDLRLEIARAEAAPGGGGPARRRAGGDGAGGKGARGGQDPHADGRPVRGRDEAAQR